MRPCLEPSLQPTRTRCAQAWYPFPYKSIPELFAPDLRTNSTAWNFTSFLPQLIDFISATEGRAINLNVPAMPCWLFQDEHGHPLNCTLPDSADALDMEYVSQASRERLVDPSGGTLAAYFSRIFAYLSDGSFVDELGATHMGGPALNLSRLTSNSTWEMFNEAEYHYDVKSYVNDYDAIVQLISERVGRANLPNLISIGGCLSGSWAWWIDSSCDYWLPYFLNRSNHHDQTVPIDAFSMHYYASSSNRSEPRTYSAGELPKAYAHVHVHAHVHAILPAIMHTHTHMLRHVSSPDPTLPYHNST